MKLSVKIIAIFFCVSCNSQTSEPRNDVSSKASLKGKTFSSDFFGFYFPIDTPWLILNEKQLSQQFRERADELNIDENENLLKRNGIELLLSLTIDTIENMPQFIISTLDLKKFQHLKDEKDYLNDYFKEVSKTYEGYNLEITNTDIEQETLGNRPFFTSLVTIKSDDFLAFQKRYSLKSQNMLLNFMINYNSESSSKKCKDLLDSIKWK